jgi:hypothetical protein
VSVQGGMWPSGGGRQEGPGRWTPAPRNSWASHLCLQANNHSDVKICSAACNVLFEKAEQCGLATAGCPAGNQGQHVRHHRIGPAAAAATSPRHLVPPTRGPAPRPLSPCGTQYASGCCPRSSWWRPRGGWPRPPPAEPIPGRETPQCPPAAQPHTRRSPCSRGWAASGSRVPAGH